MAFSSKWIAIPLVCLGLTACGKSTSDQAIIGGIVGIGASGIFDANPATGAIVGAVTNIAYCQAHPGACD
jgi:hypothetical protein